MKQHLFCSVIVLFLSLFPEFIFSQPVIPVNPKDSILRVSRTTDFIVNGEGNSPHWNQVKWIRLQQRKGTGEVYNTFLKILYSDSGIYCLFKCEDRKITATLKEDFLDLYNEDVVEVFFWTDERIPIYFEYELSPLNYELPILVPNHSGDFLGWRPWHYEGIRKTTHAAYIQKNKDRIEGWIAEFFIPYALLKPLQNVPPKKGTKWRANFYRIDYDNGISQWSWQLTRKNFHDYERFGTLLFD